VPHRHIAKAEKLQKMCVCNCWGLSATLDDDDDVAVDNDDVAAVPQPVYPVVASSFVCFIVGPLTQNCAWAFGFSFDFNLNFNFNFGALLHFLKGDSEHSNFSSIFLLYATI